MTKREKVIKALEHCISQNDCDGCPYGGECDRPPNRLDEDTLSLLREQEPRVLTLEEVIDHYSLPPVFVDDLSIQEDYMEDISPLYFDFPDDDESWTVHWRGYHAVRKYLDDWKASYGKKWICWTKKPTKEQRKAVKWDDRV